MKIDSTITGIHSRSEETVQTSRDFDRGRASEESLEKCFEIDSKNLVDHQIRSGLSLVSDGQLKWQDFLRPFSESIKGLESGADLSRWFDTNSFYRKPSVVSELESHGDFPIEKYDDLSAFRALNSDPLSQRVRRKISVPGPFTLASLVEDRHYNSKNELTRAFARIIRRVIISLSQKGFDVVQINEPSLVYRYGVSALSNQADLDSFVSSFSESLSSLPVEVILHTYFGDCSKILPELVKLSGVSAVGIDFTQTSLSDIQGVEFDGKVLGCACINGRNSLIESPEWISKYCNHASEILKPSGLIVLPSSELKYLPRGYADKKIKSIGDACSILKKGFHE